MAANQSSPGVVIQERDLTTITTLSTANVGVIAAPFEQGPVEEIVQISNERQLTDIFGKPNDNNYEYWFTASQFLSYGGILKTVRVTASALKILSFLVTIQFHLYLIQLPLIFLVTCSFE